MTFVLDSVIDHIYHLISKTVLIKHEQIPLITDLLYGPLNRDTIPQKSPFTHHKPGRMASIIDAFPELLFRISNFY